MFKVPALFLLLVGVVSVSGHGRLTEPPSRASMWRFGFDTPANYNDHELFCGGYGRQYDQNGGKCGICGDPWDEPEPRAHEDGGTYGKGVIARTYKPGQVIDVTVQLTAHHMGYFEFKLCPVQQGVKTTQQCLDKYPLQLADGSGTKYNLPPGSGPGKFPLKIRLPAGVTCDRCAFQWHYYTGNRWGYCEDGSGRNGCGPQETFRACADVAIKA